ncbi:hypothetical protein EX30DRAFT_95185 [Ascodesmis nigricans]|uniref:Uncharacterized protein n=1 Tax=Ascodesmis nigricans TaxID=341454 RepID=A0A4V3SJH0_9PEZI|nr:hypothetical protein EX30DRAFT_95185 [Ascodesmis nigricans]
MVSLWRGALRRRTLCRGRRSAGRRWGRWRWLLLVAPVWIMVVLRVHWCVEGQPSGGEDYRRRLTTRWLVDDSFSTVKHRGHDSSRVVVLCLVRGVCVCRLRGATVCSQTEPERRVRTKLGENCPAGRNEDEDGAVGGRRRRLAGAAGGIRQGREEKYGWRWMGGEMAGIDGWMNG